MSQTVYIGLGSNLSTPIEQLKAALKAIAGLPDTQFVCCSSLYGSKPMGPQDQPDYVNAVAKITTLLTPESLLNALQTIELEQGRERKDQRWGPRTLDLDILLIDQQIIDSPHLVVPHYGLKEREFVLYPLAEISPELVLPDGEKLKSVLKTVARNGLHKMTTDVEI